MKHKAKQISCRMWHANQNHLLEKQNVTNGKLFKGGILDTCFFKNTVVLNTKSQVFLSQMHRSRGRWWNRGVWEVLHYHTMQNFFSAGRPGNGLVEFTLWNSLRVSDNMNVRCLIFSWVREKLSINGKGSCLNVGIDWAVLVCGKTQK